MGTRAAGKVEELSVALGSVPEAATVGVGGLAGSASLCPRPAKNGAGSSSSYWSDVFKLLGF